MEAGYLTELVTKIVPYVTDFATALSILLYDVVLRLLGALYVIAKLTPTRWDDRLIGRLIKRVRGTRKQKKTRSE